MTLPRLKHNPNLFKGLLDPLIERYHRPAYLDSDPLGIAHEWKDPRDQEIVAIFSALLAYGNAQIIRRTLRALFDRFQGTGTRPSEWIKQYEKDPDATLQNLREEWNGIFYRFNSTGDLVLLFELIARSTLKFGSVGEHFLRFYDPNKPGSLEESWSAFIEDWSNDARELKRPGLKGFRYLLTSPKDGSACKRWVMLLRWMGRRDEIDLGLWMEGGLLVHSRPLCSADLFMPIDTHTGRITQYIGILKRKQYNWKAVLEVTEFFKKLEPNDPILYDFALARLGILDLCQKRYRVEICQTCSLLPACQFAKKQRAL
ncbi:MAG: TIGR02757 family protein [Proteobacteria bacterium]|nr:MAG: TIGR02757 family protein [Pseudomonadota bacterium]